MLDDAIQGSQRWREFTIYAAENDTASTLSCWYPKPGIERFAVLLQHTFSTRRMDDANAYSNTRPYLSVRILGSHGIDFHEILYLSIFWKSVRKFKFHWNLTRLTGTNMKTSTHIWSHLAQFILEWKMLPTKVVQKIKTHLVCSVTIFIKSCNLWDVVEKYCRPGQATDGNIIQCMSFARWVPKATDTHLEYVTFIALPLQQWLHQPHPMLP